MERSGGAERTTLRNEPQPRMNYAPKSMKKTAAHSVDPVKHPPASFNEGDIGGVL